MSLQDDIVIEDFEGSGLRVLSLPRFEAVFGFSLTNLPISVRILLEGALRACLEDHIALNEALDVARWDATQSADLPFRPARVLMQDAAGLPLLVDMAALRDAVSERGGDPRAVDFSVPATLVVDHSIQIERWGDTQALQDNQSLEMSRNRERYAFLRWAAASFRGLNVVPPGNAIIHQAHLERIAKVVARESNWLLPDTVIGTDSHTTMINGLGVLGWGVGGIEAEEVLLGETLWLSSPNVVGIEFIGNLQPGTNATDLVLHLTDFLRSRDVVGQFLEFYGPGVAALSVAERATIANMAPEYGATLALFPIDQAVCDYLRATGRDRDHTRRVATYCRHQGLFGPLVQRAIDYPRRFSFDLSQINRTIAGPSRPNQRLSLSELPDSLTAFTSLPSDIHNSSDTSPTHATRDGDIAIAAITSCTNTSNPKVMIEAGLLARNAVSLGLTVRPWVKTSLSPGSRRVTDTLRQAGLLQPLEALGFHCVAYGCATCVGNSGAIDPELERAVEDRGARLASVLSGNRNFENRIHGRVAFNYLMSPALVVAFALRGTVCSDLTREPVGIDKMGNPVMLEHIWPREEEVVACLNQAVPTDSPEAWSYPLAWDTLPAGDSIRFTWSPTSSFLRRPPFFDGPAETFQGHLENAQPLLILGDNVTTDHISPVGPIRPGSEAARYLNEHGVNEDILGTFASRRGNHHVLELGTFSNPRLYNRLVGEMDGPWTLHRPSGEVVSVSEAARRYSHSRTPLVIIAGANYGMGSARDWAAKGPALLGVRAVIARSFERIHRSNLIGVGIAPIVCDDTDTIADFLCAHSDATLQLQTDMTNLQVMLTLGGAGYDAPIFEARLNVSTTRDRQLLASGGVFKEAATTHCL